MALAAVDAIPFEIRFALLLAVAGLVYRWHIGRHPWVPCDKCSGSAKTQHLGMRPHGACGRCGGTGRRRRFATWILRYDRETGQKRGRR